MSLLSLASSFANILSEFNNFSPLRKQESMKNFEKIINEKPAIMSLKLVKKIAYLCNYKFKTSGEFKLQTAENFLLSWVKTAKNSETPVPESIHKLLIITYINQSIFFETIDPSKAMLSIISAIKISEQQKFKTTQGKFLKYISKLRECDMCITKKKYELAIHCAQTLLKDLIQKLRRVKKKTVKFLSVVAISTFYKIGVCEEARGMKKAAEKAYESANIIKSRYLAQEKIKEDLDKEFMRQRQKHKKFTVNNSPSPRFLSDRFDSRLLVQINSHFSSERNLNSDPEKKKKNPKIPGRYYSNEKLHKLNLLLIEKKDPIILNSDNYFFRHIWNDLKIDENISDKVGIVTSKVKEHVGEVSKFKEILKSKRKPPKSPQKMQIYNEFLQKRISTIEKKFENKLKIREIQLRSKLKSKINRKLLKTINIPTLANERNPPAQVLFFKQPESRRSTQTLTNITVIEPEKEEVFITTKNVEEINHEIENQLEEIFQELNATPIFKDHLKKIDTDFCSLAKSTLKHKSIDPPIVSEKKNFVITRSPRVGLVNKIIL